jgi:3-phenylpropionate/trans-cinnamate dioxygenase ferredoxin reductase subunit
MTTSSTIAIAGGGLAAAKAAEALRDSDFGGNIVVFAAEEHLPYERPPLSKEFQLGKKDLGDIKSLIRSREPVDPDQLVA